MTLIGEMSLNLIKLITGLVYWTIFFPIGMISKVFGIKYLNFGWREGETYWEQREGGVPASVRYKKES
jgi:hypothetical protein